MQAMTSGQAGQLSPEETEGIYTSLSELVELSSFAKRFKLPSSRMASQTQSGAHQSRFRGRGMEFSEVRTYQPGDDVRSIDWRVTARRQAPHTKLFQEERERPVFILCDQSSNMFFGSQGAFKSVTAARAAAILSWSALAHNDRVGGLVFSEYANDTIKPSRSRRNVLRLLSTAERFNRSLPLAREQHADLANTGSGLELALKEASRVVKTGTLVFIISDFITLNASSIQYLSAIAKHNELVLLKCSDPLESNIPSSAALPVKDGEELYYVANNDADARQSLNDYNQLINSRLESIERSYRAKRWSLDTTIPIEQQMIDIAAKVRGVR